MKAEDVDAELVEKAARVWYESNRLTPLLEWESLEQSPGGLAVTKAYRKHARVMLAAVLPDIQAQALEDAADGMHSAQHTGCFRMTCPDCREFRVRTDVRAYLRARAARLTTKTEGTTT